MGFRTQKFRNELGLEGGGGCGRRHFTDQLVSGFMSIKPMEAGPVLIAWLALEVL
jgi:hypothetical protein